MDLSGLLEPKTESQTQAIQLVRKRAPTTILLVALTRRAFGEHVRVEMSLSFLYSLFSQQTPHVSRQCANRQGQDPTKRSLIWSNRGEGQSMGEVEENESRASITACMENTALFSLFELIKIRNGGLLH